MNPTVYNFRKSEGAGRLLGPGRGLPGSGGVHSKAGAVLVFTLIMIFLAAVALFLFIEKAIYEIRTEAVHAERDRLRPDAVAVLETVMAVLHDVYEIDGNLYDPRQGWSDPLEYAGVTMPEGMNVTITFRDEHGKLPLAGMDRERLILLFEHLDFEPTELEDLADALLAWVDESYDQGRVVSGFSGYDRGDLPYRASYQPLRSLHELAAIEGFRDYLFDSGGVPNDRFYRLAEVVSLRNFAQVNVNSASETVLRVWGNYSDADQLRSADAFRDEALRPQRTYFENLAEANAELGLDLPGGQFGTAIRYLRVNVQVSYGGLQHRLSAVLDLNQPAALPAVETPSGTANGATGGRTAQGAAESTSFSDHVLQSFPFTIVELRENASIVH